MANLTLKLCASGSNTGLSSTTIEIGDQASAQNTIEFDIVLSLERAKSNSLTVWVEVGIPTGNSGLVDQKDTQALVMHVGRISKDGSNEPLQVGQGSVDDKGLLTYPVEPKNGIALAPGENRLHVAISGILCRTSAGTSSIKVTAEADDSETTSTQSELLPISKRESHDGGPILYFTAFPSYLTRPGMVELRWGLRGSQKMGAELLYSGTSKTLGNASESINRGVEKIAVQRTTDFTLQLPVGELSIVSQSATVTVLEPGPQTLNPLAERSIRYDQYAVVPTILFDTGGFHPAPQKPGLYAVLIERFIVVDQDASQWRTLLACSNDGMNNWMPVDCGELPAGSESSPGVRIGNRLWLIGGSAVDPAVKSNAVYSLDLERPEAGWQEGKNNSKTLFTPRMGHACVVYDSSTVYVLGGIDEFGLALNDVWKLTFNSNSDSIGNGFQCECVTEAADWPARCLFAAVRFKGSNSSGPPEIWIFCGVDSPNGQSLGDIWRWVPSKSSGSKSDTQSPWHLVNLIKDGSLAGSFGVGVAAVTERASTFLILELATRSGKEVNRKSATIFGVGNYVPRDRGLYAIGDSISALFLKPYSISTVLHSEHVFTRLLSRDLVHPEESNDMSSIPLYVYVTS